MTADHPFTALTEGPTGDYRGEPTFCCPCGCNQFLIVTVFDEETRLPGFFLRDAMCVTCSALLSVPFPSDIEEDHDVVF